MRTSLNINIPNPCHEDWSKMTLQQQGRHCSSCEKTVYDFTSKTDEQIVKTFLDKGKICGRFKSTQLNRELVLSRKEKNNYLSYVASTLFAFFSFGTQDVKAQGKSRIVKVNSLKNQMVNGKMGTSILNSKTIHGTIYNSHQFPIPNVNVMVKGSYNSTRTNIAGNFKLKGKLGDVLIIEAKGFKTTEVTITDFGNHQIYIKTNHLESDNKAVKTDTISTLIASIKGNIVSKTDGLPLPGVKITNLQSKVITQSDFDGNFSIEAETGNKLKFEFVGVKPKKVKINDKRFYKIKMTEDLSELTTIVASGYPSYIISNYDKNKTEKNKARKVKRQNIKNRELDRTTVGNFLYNITNIFRRKE
ncbi:carboxypeptidase-like regulatory domain-containing protein [Psychroserpens damuponensis]|uniref:carboxypeptidase-like regulatory domain-containing protein n=1 Tax=Psychroserpens damuponensis TaxID=943936 RepID=UPI0005918178|nr:carboxypeptidase-like regulatory domain-containing protein [Psychroserpens damuponensis]